MIYAKVSQTGHLTLLPSLIVAGLIFWSMGHRSSWDSPQAKEPSRMP